MSDAIQGAISRLKKLRDSVEQIAITELEKNPSNLVKMNREQLMNGIDADGGDMPNYADSNKKKSGKINLFDTGDFQRGIEPIFSDDGVDMISADSKAWFLDPFREVINTLGLTDENIDKWLKKAIPNIQKTIKKALTA